MFSVLKVSSRLLTLTAEAQSLKLKFFQTAVIGWVKIACATLVVGSGGSFGGRAAEAEEGIRIGRKGAFYELREARHDFEVVDERGDLPFTFCEGNFHASPE